MKRPRLLHPDTPFAARRSPFFYGWVVLGAATLGMLASIPGQTVGVSVFTDPLLEATGLSRLSLSGAYLVGTLASGALLPVGGRLFDRFGARPTAMGAALALAATLLWLSVVDRAARALGGSLAIPVGPLAWSAVALGFVALRFSGQGMLTMSSRSMLGKWFDRRRGLTAAISGVFLAFGFAMAPRLLDGWIGAAGWRGAWRQLAAILGIGVVLIIWVFFRDNPEECGLGMDGEAPAAPEAEASSTRAEAVRTLAFWSVTLTLAVQSMVMTGLTFHIVDIGEEAGLGRTEAISLFVPIAVFATATGALVGWLADRVRIRSLVVAMLLGELLGYGAASQLSSDAGYALAVVGIGATAGFYAPLAQVALPRLFGRIHLGAISGVQLMLMVTGGALGPSLFALSDRAAGSYVPALYVAAALPLGILVPTLIRAYDRDVPPRRRSAS